MKFSEYINEGKTLIGLTINGVSITKDTPNTILDDRLNCSELGLTSLKGAPAEIKGSFWCDNNQLKSLKGCPRIIKGVFSCASNDLTSLIGGPTDVGGSFVCNENELTSLKGAPREVGGYFDCSHNKLTSLEYIPPILKNDIYCDHNKLKSLKDIHKIITKMNGHFLCNGNQIKSHVLGLLLIPGLKKVDGDELWGEILNKYVGKGRKGMLDCQNELIEAGYEEYAQL